MRPRSGVTGLGVLDLDDVRAPIGQDSSRGGHEGPRGDFEDSVTRECFGHGEKSFLLRAQAQDSGLPRCIGWGRCEAGW